MYGSLTNFFATQQFHTFWWLVFPSILLEKSWKLYKLLNLISSFNFAFSACIYSPGFYESSHMLMRENVNKDVCKDLQPGKKRRRSCGQVLVRNSRNKENVAKTKINTFAPILVLVLATLKAVSLQLNGMLMKWKIQQAMQDDYMPSTPPEFIPLSSQ